MTWPADSQVLEYLVRLTAVFALALVFFRLFRRDLRSCRICGLLAFSSPVLLALPLARIHVPVLSKSGEPLALTPRVFETDPAFASLATTYLNDPQPGWPALLVVAAAGVGLAFFLLRWIATLRIVRSADQVADERVVALTYEIGETYGLSDAPVVKRSDRIDSPCLWGIGQPVILLPTALEGKLSDQDWRHVLSHEIAHLAQRDPLRLAAFAFVRHIFWWHPLAVMAEREAALVQEQSVDVRVTSGGPTAPYAKLLVASAAVAPGRRAIGFLGRCHLLSRVRLLHSSPPVYRSAHLLALAPVLVPIVPLELAEPYEPNPSRIGRDEVLFHSTRSDPKRMWRASADGRNPSPMPSLFTGVGTPSVSPDGRWMVYCRTKDRKEDIYVARVDGTGERLLVSTPDRDFLPSWSPDGLRLLFCTMATGQWEIAVAEVETGRWQFVTLDNSRNLEPSWHPNGERMVFSSHRSGFQTLWSMNLDGTELVQLTRNADDTGAKYSRDGRYLIFSSRRRSKYEAVLLDLVTKVERPLVRLAQLDTGEVRFTDGERAVVMSSSTGSGYQVGKVWLGDLRFEKLTSEGDNHWPVTR